MLFQTEYHSMHKENVHNVHSIHTIYCNIISSMVVCYSEYNFKRTHKANVDDSVHTDILHSMHSIHTIYCSNSSVVLF